MKAFAHILAVIACVAACSSEGDESEWIHSMQQASAEADRLAAEGDLHAARATAEDALRMRSTGVHPDDVRVVRQDLLFRVGRILLLADDFQAALSRAEEGLSLGRGNDVFTANLLILRGRAFEGRKDPAKASRDYHDALVINEKLLDSALGGVPKESP